MSDNLKVLRVQEGYHLLAKVQAAKKGIKLQVYIEQLIQAEEQGLIDWNRLKTEE